MTEATQIRLDIGGMTCASCAARIEKRLNRIEGVAASVNYATEQARVDVVDGGPAVEEIILSVEGSGYTARLHQRPGARVEAEPGGGRPDAGDATAALRQRLVVSAVLGLPVVLLAMIPALQFDAWQWASLTLAAPVVVWGALPFHRAAWANLRHATATMDTLVSLGTLAAFAWSLYALFLGDAGDPTMRHGFSLVPEPGSASSQIYLEVAAGVTVFLLAGRYAEARAKRRAGAALAALGELGAKDVGVLRSGVEHRVPVEELRVGDRFVVRPGERIATDGVVEDGGSAVDVSLLTGEPLPVDVGPGDEVTGSTLNRSGRLVVRATRVGADTAVARIARLVEDAQSGKARIQRLADRVSAVFVPIVVLIAAATFGFWWAAARTDSLTMAFTASVAVLIVACPCALGLATPTALMVGTGRGAQLGILIRGPEVLESTRRIDTIVLDKTGTVTTGSMVLHGVVACGASDTEVLLRAASVEVASEHPIAQAVVAAASGRGLAQHPISSFRSHDGLGVTAEIEGERIVVGRPVFLGEQACPLTDELAAAAAAAGAEGRTVVAVGWGGVARGVLVVGDEVRATSAEAIARLKRLGLRPILLTGDNEDAARAVAASVGIDEVVAGVRPEGKVEAVRALQADGHVVAMVGDGVNDAAALAQADLGISMGTGTDVAIEASDLTLVRPDLTGAADAIRLSRRTLAVIKGNLFWAFAYNVAAIPIAAAGLLAPMLAGGAMAFSSVFVVTNSLRLRRFRGG